MSKTVAQALMDEVHYPIPCGYVENVCIKRGFTGDETFSYEISASNEYKGALADCYYSLLTAVSFSESDKNFGALTDKDKERLLGLANRLYGEIGEEEKYDGTPAVYIGDAAFN